MTKDPTGIADAPYPNGQVRVGARRRGRPPSTSRAELERLTLELFLDNGFDNTTVEDVATAAGIGRRTFFRYFASKNDVPWGDFDANLDRMRGLLAALPDHLPVLEALRTAVLDFNRVDAAEAPWLRRRMQLILTVPALQAHSMIKYAEWRQAVAEFVAARTGTAPTALAPQAVGWAALGVSIAAYEQWLADPDADLSELLDAAYRNLATGFAPDVVTTGA
jgi:TetR/AcrR family transcriptional regulator, regulator of mycofactocin system